MIRASIGSALALIITLIVSDGASSPSEALDLTGTWEGKLTCDTVVDTGFPNGIRLREVLPDQTLEIVMLDALRFRAQLEGGSALLGAAMDDGTVTTKGKAAAQQCFPSSDVNRTLSVNARVNDTTGTGSMRGQVLNLLISNPGVISTCMANFRRISAAPPTVDPC